LKKRREHKGNHRTLDRAQRKKRGAPKPSQLKKKQGKPSPTKRLHRSMKESGKERPSIREIVILEGSLHTVSLEKKE